MKDANLLHDFVAVYRRRSFRAAADDLGSSQSSVTKRIRQLENQLGMRLFNRTTRSVDPTDNARHLIGYAENSLNAAAAFHQEARLLTGGEIGSIRIGAIALAAETSVASSLARLAATHPALEVEVVVGSSDVYRDLATGECDVVIGDRANFEMSSYASRLRVQPVQMGRLVFVHRRSHPAAGTRRLKELLCYPIAIPSRYFNENQLFATLAEQSDPPASPRYRLNSLSACMQLVSMSDVVTLAPSQLMEMAGSDLVASDLTTGIDYTVVLATVARNQPTPAMRAFEQAVMRSVDQAGLG